MESPVIMFKSIAVLHTAAGYLFFSLGAQDELQEMHYRNRNPLMGDFIKYFAHLSCLLLVACGLSAFFLPKLTATLAWLSLGFFMSPAVLDMVSKRRWLRIEKASLVSSCVRALAAAALTALTP